eukprot:CAMPEP_0185783032 /NCGR_PEP_ID=MMETSP1174-20130828/113697_1 /TAXON_ID=35687 /ORGANISM="Dictyocha speculum, Strain CCMP1381" /LENGTH=80 /DNA_ID=CAMNT_0028473831 /DNA_START=26 /DNA_END=265 /DNA_ORIENTATION=-
MALVLKSAGRYEDSRPLFQRSADLYTDTLGPDHKDTVEAIQLTKCDGTNDPSNHTYILTSMEKAAILRARAKLRKEADKD